MTKKADRLKPVSSSAPGDANGVGIVALAAHMNPKPLHVRPPKRLRRHHEAYEEEEEEPAEAEAEAAAAAEEEEAPLRFRRHKYPATAPAKAPESDTAATLLMGSLCETLIETLKSVRREQRTCACAETTSGEIEALLRRAYDEIKQVESAKQRLADAVAHWDDMCARWRKEHASLRSRSAHSRLGAFSRGVMVECMREVERCMDSVDAIKGFACSECAHLEALERAYEDVLAHILPPSMELWPRDRGGEMMPQRDFERALRRWSAHGDVAAVRAPKLERLRLLSDMCAPALERHAQAFGLICESVRQPFFHVCEDENERGDDGSTPADADADANGKGKANAGPAQ